MGYQPSELNCLYSEYREKYKDRYKLMTGSREFLPNCAEKFWIKYRLNKPKVWIDKSIPEQPEKGFWSLMGHKEYSDEEWAKKCFIEFVDKNEKNKIDNSREVE